MLFQFFEYTDDELFKKTYIANYLSFEQADKAQPFSFFVLIENDNPIKDFMTEEEFKKYKNSVFL